MYTLCYHSIHKWLVKKPSFNKAKNISNRKKNELSFSNCHWGQKKKGYRGGKLQERRVTVSFVEFYFHLVEKKKRWTLCWNTWEEKKKRQLWFTWEFLLWAVLNWPILTMHELGRQDISASPTPFQDCCFITMYCLVSLEYCPLDKTVLWGLGVVSMLHRWW